MMEKLLHERLRDDASMGEQTFSPSELEAFANEIERYYIPRPRFEDGEPVQFGDEAQNENGGSDRVYIMTFYGNGAASLRDGTPVDICELDQGQFIKRPTHKVYDADDAEIKVGDTVYRIEGDWFGHVLSFEFNDNGEPMVLCDSMKSPAKKLTHELPIFDAEGVRYVRGEKVWSLAGIEYTVEEVIDADHIRARLPDSERAHATFTSRTLTHREPDSLEMLLEDMEMCNFSDMPRQAEEWTSRLAALIERGA